MAKKTRNPRALSKKLTPDQEADVHAYVEAVVRRADEDAELLSHFLKPLGLLGKPASEPVEPHPAVLETMLKATAFMRLARWEHTDSPARIGLPSPDDLLADLGKPLKKQKFDGGKIAFDMFKTWHQSMSWQSIEFGTDVIVRDLRPRPIVDELAQLLWQFRHLVSNPNTNNNGTEE